MEEVWRHTFDNELRITPEKLPVLMSEPAHNTKAIRSKTTQIMVIIINR
jgi:actin